MVRSLFDKLFLCTTFCVLYLVAFTLSDHLNLVHDFAPGISLAFIPAGIKLVAALISGFWGVLGTAIALSYVAPEFWVDQPTWFYITYGCVSAFTTLFAVNLIKRLLRISPDLSNLRLLHLPVIDLFSTLCHGFVVNAFFIICNLNTGPDLLMRATAMAVGDFVGGMILLVTFAVTVKIYQPLRSRIGI